MPAAPARSGAPRRAAARAAATRAGCSASSPPSSRSSCSPAASPWATPASRAARSRSARRRVPAAATRRNELALISEAWKAIQDNYVDAKNLNDRDLAYGAIRGLTEAVGDEGHTSFLTADEAKAVDQSLSGTFVGIGVQLDSDDDEGPDHPLDHPGHPGRGGRPQARRPDRQGGRHGDDRPVDRRGRVARPRSRGRGGHPDHPARRAATRSTSRSSASSSTCRWSAGRWSRAARSP